MSLSVRETDGNRDILFQGIVQDVKVKAIQGSYYMEVYAISYSYLLDIGKKEPELSE